MFVLVTLQGKRFSQSDVEEVLSGKNWNINLLVRRRPTPAVVAEGANPSVRIQNPFRTPKRTEAVSFSTIWSGYEVQVSELFWPRRVFYDFILNDN